MYIAATNDQTEAEFSADFWFSGLKCGFRPDQITSDYLGHNKS